MRVVDYQESKALLKTIMLERGFTVKELQNELGLESSQAIYKWINPRIKSYVSLDNIVALSEILDVPVDEMLVTKSI